MLASVARRLVQSRVAKTSAAGTQMARPVAGSFRKARAASLAAVFRRKYAMMSYTDAFVAGDYAAYVLDGL